MRAETSSDDLRRALEPAAATWSRGEDDRFAELLERAGSVSVVLLGEASHGTREFYETRAALTRRLIEVHAGIAVAVEADWPDAYRVNRYVRHESRDAGAEAALADFRRFPQWMWRNETVLAFVEWLRQHNAGLAPDQQVGFFGLDLYSLQSSIGAVLDYLQTIDPAAARRARERYGCFDHYTDPQTYGQATGFGEGPDCEKAVITQLLELRSRAWEYLSRDGLLAQDAQFCAEQNARLVRNAEAYYRQMYRGDVNTWNVRDRHMAGTLSALIAHQAKQGRRPRVVVWAHNSHLGDARATGMARRGELNLGQLVREQRGDDCFNLGFTTHSGTVSAASDWGAPVERKFVRPALRESCERLFHDLELGDFAADLCRPEVSAPLRRPRLERAIGVIYRPRTERLSHYFEAQLPAQFDAVIHLDRTDALVPLERTPEWSAGEGLPETFPSGV